MTTTTKIAFEGSYIGTDKIPVEIRLSREYENSDRSMKTIAYHIEQKKLDRAGAEVWVDLGAPVTLKPSPSGLTHILVTALLDASLKLPPPTVTP